MFFYIKA